MSDSPSATLILDDPSQWLYLPMLYTAWSDGMLGEDEIGQICQQVRGNCQHALGPWLDPERPPSAADLQRLLTRITRATRNLDRNERLTLVELSLILAQTSDHEVTAEERDALVEIERILGIDSREAARQLLATRRPAAAPAKVHPSFEAEAMQALLDGEHRELRQRVRQLLSQDSFRYLESPDRSAYREKVLGWCRALAAEGLGGLSYPQASGGQDDIGSFVATFETLAFHDLSLLVKFGVQFGLFGGSIHQLGSARHHQRYLKDVASLELPGCFAMTETGHGSNVQDLETVARYDKDSESFILHTPHPGARKDYIGNAALHGRLATVFAQLEIGDEAYGVHAFLVPIRDASGQVLPGVTIEDCGEKLGLNGVDNGRLTFKEVLVPRENLLDRFAQVSAEGEYSSPIPSASKRFFTMLGTLVGGRVSVACGALSAAKSALTIAIRYGTERRQFGPEGESELTLLDYRTHQRRLLPLLAQAYALHFALEHLRDAFANSGADADRRQLEVLAAGLKAWSTWNTTQTIQTCRECCGGQGYLAVNRFAALKADTDVFTTFEGDNVVLLLLVAKGLLTDFKHHFAHLHSLLRYLAGRAAANVTERNPITTRLTDEQHLRDRGFHLAAFHWRKEHLTATAARRLKKRIDSGMETSQAFVECQPQLVEAANAHVEWVILDRFIAAIERTSDPALVNILERLEQLFALWRLEQDRGWFLEHGYFEPGKAKAIRRLVNILCRDIRGQALPLAEAFGIPTELLAAPIAS